MGAGGAVNPGIRAGYRVLRASPGDENCDDAEIKRQKDFQGFSQLRWRGFAAAPKIVLINRWCGEDDDQLDD